MNSFDFLCLLGAGAEEWQSALLWLEEKMERRLVLVDENDIPLHKIAAKTPRVKCRTIDSPLQIELLAKKTAWEAVFMEMKITGGASETLLLFRKELERVHLAANLLLSDAADWGCAAAKNSFMKRNHPARDGTKLAGAFRGMPAIVIGAGPSLKKNGHLLKHFREKALLFTGGSALNMIDTEPHFAASIDAAAPYRQFKQHPFSETPFCFQSRMSMENFSLIHGDAILFPDSHYAFLKGGAEFDGGWTVGTFLASLATLMGCDPIIFVGMDLCYEKGHKYADGRDFAPDDGLVKARAKDGRKVLTQKDWLIARQWLQEWAVKHPERKYIDATEGGMGFDLPIETMLLSELHFQEKTDLRKRVHDTIQTLPYANSQDWAKWRESLERCGRFAGIALFDAGEAEEMESEDAFERLLAPLWRIWAPVFERALELETEAEKLKINRLLFFKQVIQEHLHAIE